MKELLQMSTNFWDTPHTIQKVMLKMTDTVLSWQLLFSILLANTETSVLKQCGLVACKKVYFSPISQ